MTTATQTAEPIAATGPEVKVRPPSRLLTLAEPGRAIAELASFYAMRPMMGSLPKGDGHGVLVLPGFMATDNSTRPMRSLLNNLGYDVAGWKLGRNVRVNDARLQAMAGCVEELFDRQGREVSIVGWSLGGVFARELAKMMPEKVRQVVSLGSPICDDRGHTSARRLFEMLNGKNPEIMRDGRFEGLGKAPPVPTTSIYTRSDGVVHWRGSIQHAKHADHDQIENIEVLASHCGLGVNPAVMLAIADRLAQNEGEWRRFEAAGIAGAMFPRRQLH